MESFDGVSNKTKGDKTKVSKGNVASKRSNRTSGLSIEDSNSKKHEKPVNEKKKSKVREV
jgi:hypothetical protein